MDKSTPQWELIFKGQYSLLCGILVMLAAAPWLPFSAPPAVREPSAALTYLCLAQAIFASILWAWSQFTYGLDTQETRLLRRFALICFHAIALSSLHLAAQFPHPYANMGAHGSIIIYGSLGLTLCYFSLESLNFSMNARGTAAPKITFLVASIWAAVLLGATFLGFSSEKIASMLPLCAAITLTLMPAIVLLAIASMVMPCSRREYKEAARKKMWDFLPNPLGLGFFYGLTAIGTLWLIPAMLIAMFSDKLYPFIALFPGYLAGALVLLRERKIQQQMSLNYTTLFASAKISMRRFARLRGEISVPWAATLGLRTANFIIDCDPQNEFTEKMTATLGQIRKEEIHAHIEKIIGSRLMSFGSVDTKIYGTINPEASLRSCVDVLLFFACVNIDIIPLVERRLKVLTSLFPIVDPDLARLVTPQTIGQLSSKMNWTFFLEFGWVDQSLIRGIDRVHYLVKSDQVHLTNQNRMLSYIQKVSKSGNVIWIGENARRKIIMEAPFLAGSIESWQLPVVAGQDDIQQNKTIYLLKFDKLIPHLQQYYNLEETRRILRDYDERVDTRKFLNMIRMQLGRADSLPAIGSVLRILSAFEFYGFREKDGALSLCLDAFEKCTLLSKDELKSEKISASMQNLFIDTIRKIGYPSQILHLAYVSKHALRDTQTIISLCKSPTNPRFFESWALLLTLDARSFKENELLDLMQLIIHALATPSIHSQMVFRTKCIEVFINIAAALHDARHAHIIGDCFNQLAVFLVGISASIEHIAFFWDAKIHIEEVLGVPLVLTPEHDASLRRYMNHLRTKAGKHSTQFMAIENRLKAIAMLDSKKAG